MAGIALRISMGRKNELDYQDSLVLNKRTIGNSVHLPRLIACDELITLVLLSKSHDSQSMRCKNKVIARLLLIFREIKLARPKKQFRDSGGEAKQSKGKR